MPSTSARSPGSRGRSAETRRSAESDEDAALAARSEIVSAQGQRHAACRHTAYQLAAVDRDHRALMSSSVSSPVSRLTAEIRRNPHWSARRAWRRCDRSSRSPRAYANELQADATARAPESCAGCRRRRSAPAADRPLHGGEELGTSFTPWSVSGGVRLPGVPTDEMRRVHDAHLAVHWVKIMSR